jgi:hypothetical protein
VNVLKNDSAGSILARCTTTTPDEAIQVEPTYPETNAADVTITDPGTSQVDSTSGMAERMTTGNDAT